ncbi:hypothetical protein Vadar_003517 [Vaccinium darrowii]|uniref:Uncharacterized protein n=1 Tax=Vaccinium darrowii TaxID=229202 RepID=A0ACB7XFK3_9ERIC|nr:hypothetical protein Vadar_003517 [Vaccinium darrowii]
MGGSESNMSNAGSNEQDSAQKEEDNNDHQTVDTAAAVGAAVALVGWGLIKLVSSSSGSGSDGKMMKAPGRNYRMPRKEFEKSPSDYFRDLRKKAPTTSVKDSILIKLLRLIKLVEKIVHGDWDEQFVFIEWSIRALSARVGDLSFEELITILNGEEMRKNRSSNATSNSNLSASVFMAAPRPDITGLSFSVPFSPQQGPSSSSASIPQQQFGFNPTTERPLLRFQGRLQPAIFINEDLAQNKKGMEDKALDRAEVSDVVAAAVAGTLVAVGGTLVAVVVGVVV